MKTAKQLRTGLVDDWRTTAKQAPPIVLPPTETELARLKAERDELRDCLKWILEDLKAMHPAMLQSTGAIRAEAILERTEPK